MLPDHVQKLRLTAKGCERSRAITSSSFMIGIVCTDARADDGGITIAISIARSSNDCRRTSVVPVTTTISTRGYFLRKLVRTFGQQVVQSTCPNSETNGSTSEVESSRTAISVLCASINTLSACCFKTRPASERKAFLFARINSRQPNSSSSCLICSDIVDCDNESSCPARVNDPRACYSLKNAQMM